MDKRVAQLNIEHFRQELARESDPARRARLRELLEEEERKLKAVLAREKDDRSLSR